MSTQSANLDLQNHWVRSTLERKQPRRLLMALVLLLTALTLVVVKDREFWFGPEESIEAEGATAEPTNVPAAAPSPVPVAAPVSAPVAVSPTPPAPAAVGKKQTVAKVYAETKVHAEKFAGEKFPASAAVANPTPAAATRATLPPMSVEVIAGDAHHTLRPGSNAVKVEIPHASGPASNAAELERMSSGVANQPDSYPVLAQRARVEGSVVLQALIGADGVIRDLRVLSGPSILTAAAQQAVRQWRFKPYLENGQPVETKAHITVSFTIKVSDNAKST